MYYNVPLVNDLDLMKKSVTNCKQFKSGGASAQDQPVSSSDEKHRKKMLEACHLYLYLSFPLCPQNILESIANFYYK